MTDQDSTILVMGPRGAGKSKFIELLAGPTKLQPNGVSTDSLRTISISPYFTDGKTIKLVKFPGFDKSETNLRDAELFIGIATFLDSYVRRREQIRAIIYLHPADGSKVADVNRNVKMLREIVQGAAVKNIVVVTTGGDQTQNTNDDTEESKLPDGLTGRGLGKPLGHDGTKLSALTILDNATKKPPTLLDLKNQNPRNTDAGKELARYIRKQLMEPRQKRLDDLGTMIEEEEDEGKVTKWEDEKTQLKDALSRLDDDWKKLGASIKWEQATKDNVELKRVIKEKRDSATKDWKEACEKLEGEKNTLQTEKNTLQTKLDSTLSFSVPIWAHTAWAGDNVYMGHIKDEQFHTNGHQFTISGSGHQAYVVRNSAGRIGVVWAGHFRKS